MSSQILLSFDIEEFDIPLEYGANIEWEDQSEISRLGSERILNLLAEEQIVATFFITVSFAEAHPELVARMVADGHEIASHGMAHSGFQESDLLESRIRLEKLSGQSVTSFRMARLAAVSKEAIAQAGYENESSINPIWLPGHYNNRHLPTTPYYEDAKFWQFPISTALGNMRFPLFWLSFKNLPFSIYKHLVLKSLKELKYFNIYIHPWEFNERAKEKKWKLPKYVSKDAGAPLLERLRKLIVALKTKGDFTTYQKFSKETNTK